jgi:hypothetical protein
MRTSYFAAILAFTAVLHAPAAEPAPIQFQKKEIAKDLEIGYAVLLVDINGDGKTDIVVVDAKRVIWYENPSWTVHTIIKGTTWPDNVCIDAYDLDGDGKPELVLGADWRPFDSKFGGTLQWLKRGKSLDDPWTSYPIDMEPTVHRIHFMDLHGDGESRLVLGPLMGRNSTKENNFMDGQPVRMIAYKIPKDPTKDRWIPEILDESLHVVHNFCPVYAPGRKAMDVLTASYEGVSLISRDGDKWKRTLIGEGNQDNPKSNRGASEVKQGKLKSGKKFIATIEPWHGNQVVVYTEPEDSKQKLWDRHVVDDRLKWGHAVWCADLDGDGDDELIIGVRDNLSDKEGERCGVRIYKALDDKGTKWSRQIVDEGDINVEDLAVADLDGDGKPDIVAVARQSHNARIYWNQGKK